MHKGQSKAFILDMSHLSLDGLLPGSLARNDGQQSKEDGLLKEGNVRWSHQAAVLSCGTGGAEALREMSLGRWLSDKDHKEQL